MPVIHSPNGIPLAEDPDWLDFAADFAEACGYRAEEPDAAVVLPFVVPEKKSHLSLVSDRSGMLPRFMTLDEMVSDERARLRAAMEADPALRQVEAIKRGLDAATDMLVPPGQLEDMRRLLAACETKKIKEEL